MGGGFWTKDTDCYKTRSSDEDWIKAWNEHKARQKEKKGVKAARTELGQELKQS